MIVWNLTDVATAVLERSLLVNHTFVVGGRTISPGQSAEVAAVNTPALAPLVQCGALAVDRLPPAYCAAKRATIVKVPPADERPLPQRKRSR